MSSGIWKRLAERSRRVAAPAPPPRALEADDAASSPDFLAAVPTVRASLGADAVISGKLSFSAPTRIDGTLRGEVRASDMLVIGESGLVDGTIRPRELLILGHVQGEVLGAERVEIGPQGVLLGTLETRTLVLREGGRFDGDGKVGPNRARVHVLAPRPTPAGAPPAGGAAD